MGIGAGCRVWSVQSSLSSLSSHVLHIFFPLLHSVRLLWLSPPLPRLICPCFFYNLCGGDTQSCHWALLLLVAHLWLINFISCGHANLQTMKATWIGTGLSFKMLFPCNAMMKLPMPYFYIIHECTKKGLYSIGILSFFKRALLSQEFYFWSLKDEWTW